MILSLDAGITTGYAVVTLDDYKGDDPVVAVCAHGNLQNEYLDPLQVHLDVLKLAHKPTHVIVEDPVIMRGHLGDALQAVMRNIHQIFPDAEHVTPAQWKQTPSAKIALPRGLTAHERDAIRLGLWYREKLAQSS